MNPEFRQSIEAKGIRPEDLSARDREMLGMLPPPVDAIKEHSPNSPELKGAEYLKQELLGLEMFTGNVQSREGWMGAMAGYFMGIAEFSALRTHELSSLGSNPLSTELGRTSLTNEVAYTALPRVVDLTLERKEQDEHYQ